MFFRLFFFLLCLVPFGLQAQDLQTTSQKASEAYRAGRYQEAQALFKHIVDTHAEKAKTLYGPRFGFFFFRKGMCELRLASQAQQQRKKDQMKKWFDLAASSFKACYKDFPNGAKNMPESTNVAWMASLQYWAEACMGSEQYGEALTHYEEFLKKRDKTKQTEQLRPTAGDFQINLAICNFLKEKPNISTGVRYFEKALKSKEILKTSSSAIVNGFLAFSNAVIEQKKEKDLVDFLARNKSLIVMDTYRMYRFIPTFLNLANKAIREEMYQAAFALYSLIPSSNEVAEDMQSIIASLPQRKGIRDGNELIYIDRINQQLTSLQMQIKKGNPYDVNILMALSFLHNQVNNQRGVYGALQQIEENYPKNTSREANLYNLVRVSSLIGEIFKTEHYGQRFLKIYPNSKYAPEVRRMMLSSLFFGGEYEKCLEVAESVIHTLPENTVQHDICLFVLGGSHFYLGHFKDADTYLKQSLKMYPKGKFAMNAKYFYGSNLTRLQYWKKAAEILDAFLKEYPEEGKNPYLAAALFDRANCHFTEKEYEQALALIQRLEDNFSHNPVMPSAYDVKGNILESKGDSQGAIASYKKALETAENSQNRFIAAEALNYLIGLLGQEKIDGKSNPNLKDVLPWYDKFLKEYPDSVYKPQVVVFGMPAMRAANREKEGLENIQRAIVELSTKPNQMFIEETINAYSKAFLAMKGNTPEKLRKVYYNFPGLDFSNKRTLALLRIALIGVYETQLKEAKNKKDEQMVMRLNAGISSLFRDLKSEFNPKELVNTVLLRVGDYLREKTASPKQALPYYEELISREDDFGKLPARLGIADILGQSPAKSDKQKAIKELEDLLSRLKDNKEIREKALYLLITIPSQSGDWDLCEKYARLYLKERHSKHDAEVSYLFAKSFDKRKLYEDALANYGNIAVRYRGYIKLSAPSVKRILEIMWDRNLPKGAKVNGKSLSMSDRQAAYQTIGYPYIKGAQNMIKASKEVSDEDKALILEVDKLIKRFESSGSIKNMDQVRAEEAERKRRGGR